MSLLPDELRYGWLFLFRLIPALMLVPAFGGRWGGRVVQSAVSLLLAVSLIPALSRMSFAEVSQANLAAIAIKELMIGLAIGIVASIALHLAESFASFIGEPTALAEPHTTLHDVWGLLFVAIFF
ncbi:MAG: flagellar biosynthetic protein FliR, partial [Myxococcales bacterium]|nr:flagellar biosynthetic protein FliR [Myxococcales bacterium]